MSFGVLICMQYTFSNTNRNSCDILTSIRRCTVSAQVVPRDVTAETQRKMLQQLKQEWVSNQSDVLKEHIRRLAKHWGMRSPALVRAKAA
jgi:hypothetical protein